MAKKKPTPKKKAAPKAKVKAAPKAKAAPKPLAAKPAAKPKATHSVHELGMRVAGEQPKKRAAPSKAKKK